MHFWMNDQREESWVYPCPKLSNLQSYLDPHMLTCFINICARSYSPCPHPLINTGVKRDPGKLQGLSKVTLFTLSNCPTFHPKMLVLPYSAMFAHQSIKLKENWTHSELSMLVQEEESGLERELVISESLLRAKHHTVSGFGQCFQVRIYNPFFR